MTNVHRKMLRFHRFRKAYGRCSYRHSFPASFWRCNNTPAYRACRSDSGRPGSRANFSQHGHKLRKICWWIRFNFVKLAVTSIVRHVSVVINWNRQTHHRFCELFISTSGWLRQRCYESINVRFIICIACRRELLIVALKSANSVNYLRLPVSLITPVRNGTNNFAC